MNEMKNDEATKTLMNKKNDNEKLEQEQELKF